MWTEWIDKTGLKFKSEFANSYIIEQNWQRYIKIKRNRQKIDQNRTKSIKMNKTSTEKHKIEIKSIEVEQSRQKIEQNRTKPNKLFKSWQKVDQNWNKIEIEKLITSRCLPKYEGNGKPISDGLCVLH